MTSLIKHRRKWRAVGVLLLVIVFLTPWAYDRIHVPAEYRCQFPHVRLEGDFCGWPYPGVLMLIRGVAELVHLGGEMLLGRMTIGNWATPTSYTILVLVLALPLLTTMALILRRGGRYLSVASVIAWGLAAVIALEFLGLLNLSDYSGILAHIWGTKAYVWLAAVMLALEVASMAAERIRRPL